MSLRHLNRWRARWQLSRAKGRPCGVSARVTVSAGRAVVCVTPRLSFVGVHLFAPWLDQQEALEPVVAGLQEAIRGYQRTHPDDDFALLHHRDDTLKSRFEALVLAPWLGMDRLSGFDTQDHPLETLLGTSYQATTLSQFLGQLERIEAAAAWLLPILLPAQGGKLVYVDGHMIAYWTVKSKAIAQAFDEAGLGLLCMLDDNEPHGVESFQATEVGPLDDGTRLYEGPWKVTREDDDRHFVIVEPQDRKPLVYWGRPQVKAEAEAEAWPAIYRARTELQENAFKRMIDHGALNLKVGRKTILGPDRHPQRAEAKGKDALEAARRRVAKKGLELEAKCEQVAQSEAPGPGKRLEQRQRAATELEAQLREAQQHEADLQEQVDGFEAPKERADRAMRQQTIMTSRPLFLENRLQAFMSELLSILPKKVS